MVCLIAAACARSPRARQSPERAAIAAAAHNQLLLPRVADACWCFVLLLLVVLRRLLLLGDLRQYPGGVALAEKAARCEFLRRHQRRRRRRTLRHECRWRNDLVEGARLVAELGAAVLDLNVRAAEQAVRALAKPMLGAQRRVLRDRLEDRGLKVERRVGGKVKLDWLWRGRARRVRGRRCGGWRESGGCVQRVRGRCCWARLRASDGVHRRSHHLW